MPYSFDRLRSDLPKWTLHLTSGVLVFFVALYPDQFKAMSFGVQILAAFMVVGANVVAGVFWDDLKAQIENRALRKEIGDINERSTAVLHAKDTELADLRKVIVQFLEYSEVFREKIVKYLELNEDYLCVAKSSEGLSDVFNSLDVKQQLPFSKVLAEWPGSIKPFENMHLYLLPASRLKGFSAGNAREWIQKNIIPKVRDERVAFLESLPRAQRRLAEEFAYKYIAIAVRKNSIEYDSLRRKFNKSFVDNIIEHQSRKRIAKLTDRLTEVITAKDFLLLVDWSSFAPLNNDQKGLLREKKQELYEELSANEVNTLTDIAKVSEDDLANIFKRVYKTKFTQKKYANLARKVIAGTDGVLAVLRSAGVKI